LHLRIFGVVLAVTLIFGNGAFADNSMSDSLLSPLKQLKLGIQLQDVKCKENFVLVIKESNERPACVKPTSVTRLLAHGWMTPNKFQSMNHYPSTKARNGTVNPVGTVIVRDLQQPGKYFPSEKKSAGPLPPITVAPVISLSEPNIVKIKAVGMSPNPLKVGDRTDFTVTYQNISGKPLYGLEGCGSDLSDTILPSTSVEPIYFMLTCAEEIDVIQPNQTVTDKTFDGYKIIKEGMLNVTLHLDLNDNNVHPSQPIVATVQFNVSVTQ
jgi:hypothetical protein